MAVDRLLQRGDTLRFLAGRDHFQKFQHHSDVTAAMSAEIRRELRHVNQEINMLQRRKDNVMELLESTLSQGQVKF